MTLPRITALTEYPTIEGIELPEALFSDRTLFITLTRKGLPGDVLKQAVVKLGHRELFVRLLETTTGNLNRFYRRKALTQSQSEAVLDTLRLFSKATSVFGDQEKALQWLECSIPALGDQIPIDLCDTFEGRKMVQGALRKIEYGEFV
jgi:putative toxin-antitoxin system antitoxin component (TIGR02293 family)